MTDGRSRAAPAIALESELSRSRRATEVVRWKVARGESGSASSRSCPHPRMVQVGGAAPAPSPWQCID